MNLFLSNHLTINKFLSCTMSLRKIRAIYYVRLCNYFECSHFVINDVKNFRQSEEIFPSACFLYVLNSVQTILPSRKKRVGQNRSIARFPAEERWYSPHLHPVLCLRTSLLIPQSLYAPITAFFPSSIWVFSVTTPDKSLRMKFV